MAAMTISMTVEDQKKAFAMALLKLPDDPFKAALSVIPDTGLALQAATTWPNDPFVKQLQLDLIELYGADKFVPTEIDQLKDIWRIAIEPALDKEIRLKAHELYAKIRQGHFKKADNISQTNILNQAVMVVHDKGSDAQWEQGCIDQQALLKQGNNAD